jgi:CRISPR type I-E-associated protein CasB/Cse2
MQAREPDEKAIKFIEKLNTLDVGEKARLKRDAGKTIAEGQNMGLFYRLLPYGVPTYQEETYFRVAALYPLLKNGTGGNFGAALRQVCDPDPKKNKSLDRRVEILLDADASQLPFRLRQAVRLIRSRNPEARINWLRLLEELLQWNSLSRWVQASWARAYFENTEKPAKFTQEKNVEADTNNDF